MTAEAWSNAVTEIIGGKAGGKEPSRVGSSDKPEKLEEAVSKAEEWLSKKLEGLKL